MMIIKKLFLPCRWMPFLLLLFVSCTGSLLPGGGSTVVTDAGNEGSLPLSLCVAEPLAIGVTDAGTRFNTTLSDPWENNDKILINYTNANGETATATFVYTVPTDETEGTWALDGGTPLYVFDVKEINSVVSYGGQLTDRYTAGSGTTISQNTLGKYSACDMVKADTPVEGVADAAGTFTYDKRTGIVTANLKHTRTDLHITVPNVIPNMFSLPLIGELSMTLFINGKSITMYPAEQTDDVTMFRAIVDPDDLLAPAGGSGYQQLTATLYRNDSSTSPSITLGTLTYTPPTAAETTQYVGKCLTVAGTYAGTPPLMFVSTQEELINSVNLNRHCILSNDIDMNNANWTPPAKFSGTVDGNGHTIRNLTITEAPYAYYVPLGSGGVMTQCHSAGVFAGLEEGAILHNLHISGVTMTVSNAQYMGVLAGRANGSVISQCSVENATMTCTNESTAISSSVGGLVGIVYNCDITRCHTSGVTLTVNKTSGSQAVYAGGLLGNAHGVNNKVVACYAASPRITGNRASNSDGNAFCYVGGLIGRAQGNVYGCYATNAFVQGYNGFAATDGGLYTGVLVGRLYDQSNSAYGCVNSCYATTASDEATATFTKATSMTNESSSGSNSMAYCVLDGYPLDADGAQQATAVSSWREALGGANDLADVKIAVPETSDDDENAHTMTTATRTFKAAAIWGNFGGDDGTAPTIARDYTGEEPQTRADRSAPLSSEYRVLAPFVVHNDE